MDFHGLSRRELQALCKRFKLPANLTNVAMADSLQALGIVEGADEVLQACKSEIVQSSAGGRSTIRRNAAKNMDGVLKESAEDNRKDVLLTPAPLGATSRRKATKDDSAVKQVYSLRRSARLAAKSGNLLQGVGNDNSDFSRKDLFAGHGQEFKMNLEESLDDSDEMTGVTVTKENLERKDEVLVDSASTNAESLPKIEEEMDTHPESEGVAENSLKILKEGGNINLDFPKKDLSKDDGLVLLKESRGGLGIISGVASLDKEEKGEAHVDSSDKQDVPISEDSEPTIEEEMNNVAEDNDQEVKEVELVPMVNEQYHSNANDAKSELNKSWGSEIEGSVDENITEDEVDSSETESNPSESDSTTLELTEGSTKSNDSLDCMPSEISSMSYDDDAFDWDLTQDGDDSEATKQVPAVEEEKAETVQPANNVTTIDQVSSNPSIHLTNAQLSEEAADVVTPPIDLKTSPTPKDVKLPYMKNETLPPVFIKTDPSFTTKPIFSTPKRASASKAYSRRSGISAAPDNKENIGSGSKTAPARERSKMVKEISEAVPKLDDHSLVQLSKNLKGLQINLKFDKNEGENEVTARTALQALPENQRDV